MYTNIYVSAIQTFCFRKILSMLHHCFYYLYDISILYFISNTSLAYFQLVALHSHKSLISNQYIKTWTQRIYIKSGCLVARALRHIIFYLDFVSNLSTIMTNLSLLYFKEIPSRTSNLLSLITNS